MVATVTIHDDDEADLIEAQRVGAGASLKIPRLRAALAERGIRFVVADYGLV
jgi:hypothetical protein